MRGVLSGRAAWALGLGIAVLGYGVDLLTKQLALAYLDPANPPVLLGGLLRLQLIFNPGAAFSMGEDFTIVLTLIAIAALVGVLAFLLVLFGVSYALKKAYWKDVKKNN